MVAKIKTKSKELVEAEENLSETLAAFYSAVKFASKVATAKQVHGAVTKIIKHKEKVKLITKQVELAIKMIEAAERGEGFPEFDLPLAIDILSLSAKGKPIQESILKEQADRFR